LIFPEGTRSEDCSILRFKKGAFYLANELNLDVIPIVIHGIGHVLPKTEFMLRKGQVNIKILERITPQSPIRHGKEVIDFSKNVRQLYKNEYEKLASQVEISDYYTDKVYHNYIYKGAAIARRAKNNLKNKNIINSFISQLPDYGNIVILNCGQGELSLLAALTKKHLQITAVETNQELFEIATNCISIPQNLFYTNSLTDLEIFDNFAALFPTLEQVKILQKVQKKVFFISKNKDIERLLSGNYNIIVKEKECSLYSLG
jgi:hypothetical protein